MGKMQKLIFVCGFGCFLLTGCATLKNNLATGDNLCTEQCKIDYPTNDPVEIFGIAGKIDGTYLNCKCYYRHLIGKQ